MQSPYHLIPVSVIILAGYFLSLYLTRISMVTKTVHRRIWNVILLVTFLISGILGLLLVVRLNYQLEWTFMKPLMKWHVDTGIAMTLVAIFHVIWHGSYFLGLFKKSPPRKMLKDKNDWENDTTPPGRMTWLLLTLGFFGTTVQVLVIREITTVFQGNELMMAWTLGIWMFLTGTGSWLGKFYRHSLAERILPGIFMLLAFLPPFMVILMNGLRNIVFLPGQLISPLWYLLIAAILLAPLCLLSGLTFTLLIKARLGEEKMFVRVYALEALGSVVGGIAVSFLMVRWLSIMESLLVTAIIIHLVLWLHQKRRATLFSGIFLILLLLAFLAFPVDKALKSILFENQEVITTKETPTGNITICKNAEEFSFYGNGTLMFSTGDMVLNEEYVHYAMLQHKNPVNVLLVSGGLAGMADEVLKYPGVRHIDMVEINPGIIKLASPYKPLPSDERITLVQGDGRRFINDARQKWDVVILAVPDASSLQINRYYTIDFLRMLKIRLNKEAVIIFGVSPAGNYISAEQARIEAAIFHTVSSLFSNIVIIPGERDYFVASDGPLSDKPGELAFLRGIINSYVNADYLDDRTISERGNLIRKNIMGIRQVNTDTQPVPVFYHSLRYLSRFTGKNPVILLLPLLLFLLPLFFMKPVSAGMYITGLTASSAEILLIFWFQTVSGNVYAAIGIIFAIFMAGLALGSFAGDRMAGGWKKPLSGQILLGSYAILLPVMWNFQGAFMEGVLFWLIFIPILLIPAFLTGYQYVISTGSYTSEQTQAASSVYAADLWGSSLGAILTTFLLVPVAGVTNCCLILAALNILIAIYMLIRK